MIVEELKQREHVLSARLREIASARDGDGRIRFKVVDDGAGEARYCLGQEHRFRAYPDEVASFRERRDKLAIESVVGLERLGRRGLKRIMSKRCPGAR